jgi:tRNA pseudouridine65 synthase
MDILFEDEYFVAVCKRAKQFIHPMSGERDSKDCLLFDVRDYVNSQVFAINRLDRPVSGIVIFAKDAQVVTKFQDLWHGPDTHKRYLCLHHGRLEKSGFFDSSLLKKGAFKSESRDVAQESLTLYKAIQYYEKEQCSYTEVEIKTGRYHQIRRHFRKAMMPIIGDRKHGRSVVNNRFEEGFLLDRIFLHCHQTFFKHPYSGESIELHCDLPSSLGDVLEQLNKAL